MVNNSVQVESLIKRKFKETTGEEYFEGEINRMRKICFDICVKDDLFFNQLEAQEKNELPKNALSPPTLPEKDQNMEYKCIQCKKILKSKKSLLYHTQNGVCEKNKHKCEKCHSEMSSKQMLQYHVDNKVGETQVPPSDAAYPPPRTLQFELTLNQ
jgi:DNA-directed RNA polymerase subunit RPC12/RpoP